MLLLILDYRGETKTMPCDLTRKEIREIVTFWICFLISSHLTWGIKFAEKYVLPYVRFHIIRSMTSCFNFFLTIFFLLLSLPALDGCVSKVTTIASSILFRS